MSAFQSTMEHDPEKGFAEKVGEVEFSKEFHETARQHSIVYENGAVPGESFEIGDGFYAKMQRLAGKFNVEQRGIERVPEDERTDTKRALLNTGSMWLAANMVISSFAIGCLGKSIWFLGTADAMLTVLFFNLIGTLPVCYFSCFGPVFGLRQMVLSRFWFGWYGVKLIAIFNVLACIGWSSVNVIVGAQLINAVNNDFPPWAGILIIALCTVLVTLFGYKVVHAYEFWSWIPTFIIFMILLGQYAHSGAFMDIPMGVGTSEAGGVLSFGAVVYGFATGWTPYAADYTVYQKTTQSKRKVFLATWLGLMIPLLFTEMLGVAIMSATGLDPEATDNDYLNGYKQAGAGGLIGAVLIPPMGNFGRFCLVMLALSIIANNCPNIYSVSLTVQVFGRWTQRIPRFIWTLVATGVYIAIAIPGYIHFELVLETFMNFIGYWLAIYEGIALVDHFVFRRGLSGYDAADYDKVAKLPVGAAAVTSFAVGIAGVVLGMSQVWYVGPIGLLCGAAPFGGDIGFELGFTWAALAYLCLRPLEKRYLQKSFERFFTVNEYEVDGVRVVVPIQ